jgi:glucokinase
MRALAVDLGGSHAACAVVEDRALLAWQTLNYDAALGLGPLLPRLGEVLEWLRQSVGGDYAGVAIGFCGIVDPGSGRVLSTNGKYDDGPRLDLPDWCARTLGLPLRLENDARLALLGERYAGAAEGCDDVVMVTLGTGVGGAAMIGGRLVRGRHFQAGCLGGHFPIRVGGRRCACGNVGCVEAEASTSVLEELCRAHPEFASSPLAREGRIDFERLLRAADDPAAIATRDYCLSVWAAGTVALIHAYDPEVVVFGGGVMRSAGAILPFIEQHVHAHAWTPWGRVQLRAAALGDRAAVLGAAPLLEEWGHA